MEDFITWEGEIGRYASRSALIFGCSSAPHVEIGMGELHVWGRRKGGLAGCDGCGIVGVVKIGTCRLKVVVTVYVLYTVRSNHHNSLYIYRLHYCIKTKD